MKFNPKKIRVASLLLILAVFALVASIRAQEPVSGPPGTAEDNAQVDIIITVGGEGLLKTSIGIPALVPMSGAKDGGAMGRDAARILTSDLDFSSYFRPVGVPDLPPPPAGGYTEQTLDLAPFSQRGAEMLIAGTYSIDVNGNYTFDLRLIDVTLKSQLGRVTYTGKKPVFRRLMHRFADEVLRLATGEKGPFETRLLFNGGQGSKRELYMSDSDGENIFQITHNKSLNISPSWSPDGTHIVYTSYVTGSPDLYILPIEGGKPRHLFGGKGISYCADWSVATNRIAFASSNNKERNQEIYTIKPDGTDLKQITFEPWAINVSPSWSPDGKNIAYVTSRYGDKPQIVVVPASGGTSVRVSRSGGYNTDPTWAPIGWSEQEYLVGYNGRTGGGMNVLAIRLDKNMQVLQTIGVTQGGGIETPSFSPDGRFIVYSRGSRNNYDIYMTSLREFRPRRITSLAGQELSPAWSRWLK